MEEQAFLLASAFRERGGLFLPVFAAPPEPVGLGRYKGAGLDFAALDLGRFRPRTLLRLLALVVRRRIEVVDWNFFAPLTNGYVWALSVLAPWVEHYFTDHNSRQGRRETGLRPCEEAPAAEVSPRDRRQRVRRGLPARPGRLAGPGIAGCTSSTPTASPPTRRRGRKCGGGSAPTAAS